MRTKTKVMTMRISSPPAYRAGSADSFWGLGIGLGPDPLAEAGKHLLQKTQQLTFGESCHLVNRHGLGETVLQPVPCVTNSDHRPVRIHPR